MEPERECTSSFPIHIKIGNDIREINVSESTRVREVKEMCCHFIGPGFHDIEKIYLWKGEVQMSDLAILRDCEVSANDHLELKRKRSRGGKSSASRGLHSFVYKQSDSREHRLQLLQYYRALWDKAPPAEFENVPNVPPGDQVLPLTASHHEILEQASCAIEQLVDLDEELQEEGPVASSLLATQPTLAAPPALAASASESDSVSAAAGGSGQPTLVENDDHTHSVRDDAGVTTNTLIPQMSVDELEDKYGKGFNLMKQLGFVPGQGCGACLQGIVGIIPSGDMLRNPSLGLGAGSSTDTAELIRCVNSASINPPECSSCNKHQWPAYRTISKGNWTCKECAQISCPTCVKCATITWDGYNIPWNVNDNLSGKWLCASCWISSSQSDHFHWKEWFERRAQSYPEVLEECSEAKKIKEFQSYEWTQGRASGTMGKWAEEYQLGRKGWNKLHWEGNFPSPEDCASELDLDFFRTFLSSRKNRKGVPLSEMFLPPEQKDEGWIYHARKFHSVKEVLIGEKAQSWQHGYHSSRFVCIHNILCVGLKNAVKMKTKKGKNVPGVYHFQTLPRGVYYHRYQLFADGTAWCIVWHILADPSKTQFAGEEQWATLQEGVEIIGAYTRGYTYEAWKAFMEQPPDERPYMTLVSQWQPELEHPVGRKNRQKLKGLLCSASFGKLSRFFLDI